MSLSPGVKNMLIATFSFAVMNVCVKFLGEAKFHVAQIILIRSVVSATVCLYGIRKLGLSPWGVNKKFLLARGVFGLIALTLYFITLHNMPLASAVTLVYLSPIFTAVMGIIWLGEKIKPIQWLLFAISFFGLALLKGFDYNIKMTYFIFGILAAAFSGVAYTAVRKVKDTDHPYVVVFYFPLIAIPVSLVWSFFEWKSPSFQQWIILIVIGVCTQIGQYYMAKALQAERAEKVVTLKYIGALYALIFGYFLFDESYSVQALIGIMMVAGGVIINVRLKH